MKCNDCRDYLIAYSEGVLEETEYSNIKAHLEGCSRCRKALEEYESIKGRLHTLDTATALPDPKEHIYAAIDHLEKTPANRKRWLRPAALAVPVILLLAVILPITLPGGPSNLLAKAAAAAENLKSFQAEKHEYYQWTETDNLTHAFYFGCRYTSPDTYYIRTVVEYDFSPFVIKTIPIITERILLDKQVYTTGSPGSILPRDSAYFERLLPTEVLASGYIDTLVDVETLEDEIIDGVECFHIKGTVDPDKYLAFVKPDYRRMYESRAKLTNLPPVTESFEEQFARTEMMVRGEVMTFELWIGKDDYLMRKWKETYKPYPVEPSQMIAGIDFYYCEASGRLFDLNEEIVIEPPLDENGELLPGWGVEPLLD